MAEAAPVSKVLAEIGPRKEIIRTMRLSSDPSVVRFLSVYDQLPAFDRDRSGIPLEAIVLRAGVDPAAIIGATVVAHRMMQAQKSALRVMTKHPKVVEKTILFAGREAGYRDRQMLHQAVGFLPRPAGWTFNLNVPIEAKEKEQESLPTNNSPEVNELFPMISDRQQHWQENRQKALQDKND